MLNSAYKTTRRSMLKNGLMTGVALSSAPLLSGCFGARKRKKKPNVLIVVLDTARADRFSCLGYGRETSPNIDKIADHGVLYRQAYATDFWTLPSHASLFTGLYPSQVGATAETNLLPETALTMASILRADGYDTAAFSCNSWVSKERGFAQGFNEFHETWRTDGTSKLRPEAPELKATHGTVSWLNQHDQADNPFFMFVNLNCVHMPYAPPNPYYEKFVSQKHNKKRVWELSRLAGMWSHLAGVLKLTAEDYQILSDLYDGEVALVDHCVGQIVAQLVKQNIVDETLIIITADHGENLGDHGMIDHLLSMYETTLHIPLVIHYPDKFAPGSVSDDLTSLVDIMPTVLDICELPNLIQGVSLDQRSLCDDSTLPRQFIIAENERPVNGIKLMESKFPSFDASTIDYPMRAIRLGSTKLIWKVGSDIELYDLKNDPGELHNLANSQPQLRDKTHAVLKKWMAQLPPAKDPKLFQSIDEESLKILRSLGYVK